MNEKELAYIAGIIDGEGSIQIFKRKPSKSSIAKRQKNFWHTSYVKISNTDIRLLDWLKKRVGGSIQKGKRRGKRRNCYELHINPSKSTELLQKVYPYLVIKKEQADVVFEFRSTYENRYCRGGLPKHILEAREKCYTQLKELHHKEY